MEDKMRRATHHPGSTAPTIQHTPPSTLDLFDFTLPWGQVGQGPPPFQGRAQEPPTPGRGEVDRHICYCCHPKVPEGACSKRANETSWRGRVRARDISSKLTCATSEDGNGPSLAATARGKPRARRVAAARCRLGGAVDSVRVRLLRRVRKEASAPLLHWRRVAACVLLLLFALGLHCRLCSSLVRTQLCTVAFGDEQYLSTVRALLWFQASVVEHDGWRQCHTAPHGRDAAELLFE